MGLGFGELSALARRKIPGVQDPVFLPTNELQGAVIRIPFGMKGQPFQGFMRFGKPGLAYQKTQRRPGQRQNIGPRRGQFRCVHNFAPGLEAGFFIGERRSEYLKHLGEGHTFGRWLGLENEDGRFASEVRRLFIEIFKYVQRAVLSGVLAQGAPVGIERSR